MELRPTPSPAHPQYPAPRGRKSKAQTTLHIDVGAAAAKVCKLDFYCALENQQGRRIGNGNLIKLSIFTSIKDYLLGKTHAIITPCPISVDDKPKKIIRLVVFSPLNVEWKCFIHPHSLLELDFY